MKRADRRQVQVPEGLISQGRKFGFLLSITQSFLTPFSPNSPPGILWAKEASNVTSSSTTWDKVSSLLGSRLVCHHILIYKRYML